MSSQDKKRLKRIKNDVIERDGLLCCYCDMVLTLETITMDHIVPDSKRGTFNATNLTVSCKPCNNKRGNQPFFEYCKAFDFSEDKLTKYKRLYFNNLKIKVLNIAKEQCLKTDQAVPDKLISQACKILKIKPIPFTDYQNEYPLNIDFAQSCHRKEIKFVFETLIRIIELDS